jgi:hypothetical protein
MAETARLDAGQNQHLRALEHANKVRLARAEMKRGIARGALNAADVILDCPWEAHSMEISDLLMSQKRWGRARCRRLLMAIAVPENKQIGTLTERQRMALSAVLAAKAASTPQRRPAPAPERAPVMVDEPAIARERVLSDQPAFSIA